MTKKYFHLIFYCLIFSLNQTTSAQYNFQRLIGGSSQERGQALFQTSDGGYLYNAATLSYGSGSADGFFVKTDSQGLLSWSKAYGTAAFDNSEFAIETYDSKLVGVGATYFPSGTNADVMMFKTNPQGQLLWSKTYGGGGNESVVHMIETSDHGYALVGFTRSIGSGSEDILFIRTDENGDTIFTRSYGTPESEVGISIVEDSTGEFIICGKQTRVINGFLYADGILLRTDPAGNILWTKLYGDSLWEELESVNIALDGGLISCGSTTTFGAGKYDILAMKTSAQGNIEWAYAYGGAEIDASYGVLCNSDSTFTISGYTNSYGYGHQQRGDDSTNIFLMRINSLGDTLWMRTYGDGLQDEAYRCSAANDGGYLVSGFTTNYTFQDSAQMMMIKTDSVGYTGCHEYTSHPEKTAALLQDSSVVFSQSSGLVNGNISLIEMLVNTYDNDACLYTGMADEMNSKKLFIFPNPIDDEQKIRIQSSTELMFVRILNLEGRLMKEISLSVPAGEISVTPEAHRLSSGIYFIQAGNVDGQLLMAKLIVQ
ncbi:MAG TPA: T9SS type A sorting domain-containing protein [Bacteroidia bacterium]|nr:T9SS type A sorting domain-containing protein [Bacteroidia bacterium]